MQQTKENTSASQVDIAFIGGSGIYQLENFQVESSLSLETPYGKTSAEIVVGKLGNKKICFIPRHGMEHSLTPSEVPYAANIYALKSIGVTKIVGISAVGSLQENIKPLDMVIPSQIIDNTNKRNSTFFGNGLVAHVSMADPFCTVMSKKISNLINPMDINHHTGKTLVVIEGPQFSTYAESHMYRQWGGDIIGMTTAPEAKLAREAEMCYTSIAMTTDYDCWNRSQDPVTSQMVISNLQKNVSNVRYLIQKITEIANLSDEACHCRASLSDALIKDRLELNSDLVYKLQPIVGKYIN